jgi:hypothetical protein
MGQPWLSPIGSTMSDPKKPNNNLRLALILLSIAVVFFVSVIGKQYILGHH